MNHWTLRASCLALALSPFDASAAYEIWGLTGPGWANHNSLIRINPDTGQGTYAAQMRYPTGVNNGRMVDGAESLEILPDGRFMAISWNEPSSFSPNDLFQVNPVTGVSTFITSIGDQNKYSWVEGMAHDPTRNVFYLSADVNGSSPRHDGIWDHAFLITSPRALSARSDRLTPEIPACLRWHR